MTGNRWRPRSGRTWPLAADAAGRVRGRVEDWRRVRWLSLRASVRLPCPRSRTCGFPAFGSPAGISHGLALFASGWPSPSGVPPDLGPPAGVPGFLWAFPPPNRLSPAGACSSPTGFPVLLSSSMRADITAETVGASVVLSIGGFPRVSFRIARVCSMLGPHVRQTAFAARFRVLQSTLLPPALAAASIAAESDTDAVHDYNGRTSAILHRARLPTAHSRPDFCSGFHASFSSTSRRRSGVILRGRREAALRRSVASWRACAVAAPAYMPVRSSRGGGRAAARSRLSIRRCASRCRSDYASVR